MLPIDPFDDHSTAEVGAARGRACIALGRLDGAVRMASPSALRLFGYRLVRRSFIGALADAGFAGADRAIDGWIARESPPPATPQYAAAEAPAISGAVLAALADGGWAPVAEAARFVARAAEHLGRAGTPAAGEKPLAEIAAEARRALVPSRPLYDVDDPLAWLEARVEGARASAAFAPVARDPVPIDTLAGIAIITPPPPRAHHWALGLAMGESLRALGLLSRPVPLAGSVPAAALRMDMPPRERAVALADAIARAARQAMAELDEAVRLAAHAAHALRTCRRTSRAPDVFAGIAGLGALRRTQIATGFGLTAMGADTILATLVSAGLVARAPGDRRGPYRWTPPPVARSTPWTISDMSGLLNEVDAAMEGLDALLARLSPRKAGPQEGRSTPNDTADDPDGPDGPDGPETGNAL